VAEEDETETACETLTYTHTGVLNSNPSSVTNSSNATNAAGGDGGHQQAGMWAIINHKPAGGQQGHLMEVDSPRPDHNLGAGIKGEAGRDAAAPVGQRKAESDITPLGHMMMHDAHETSNGKFAAEVHGERIYSDPQQ
jgi:hypothetical protein